MDQQPTHPRSRRILKGMDLLRAKTEGTPWRTGCRCTACSRRPGSKCRWSGRQTRNLPGRKTDMQDCQWGATLHAHGLLRAGFVPPAHIRRIQDYTRLRRRPHQHGRHQVQRMQQALERMNIKPHDVIAKLTGVSGLDVVRAILGGATGAHAACGTGRRTRSLPTRMPRASISISLCMRGQPYSCLTCT